MPRKRDPRRYEAFEIWKSNKNIKLKDIAANLGVSDTQIRKWKSQDKWEQQKGNVTKSEIRVTKKEYKTISNDLKKVTKKNDKKIDKKEDAGLTEKQRLFCLYYVKSFNATQAAIKAGYTLNYPSEIGYQLLQKPTVKSEIERLKTLKMKSIMINEDDIVDRYMRIAFADMTDFVEFGQEEVPIITKDGPIMVINSNTGQEEPLKQSINVLKFKESEIIDGALISEVKTSRQGASIKLEDRLKALEWLANFFDMNPEHKYRKEHDKKKLELEQEKFEYQKKIESLKAW